MSDEFQALEATLAGLHPAALDARLLARLNECTSAVSPSLTPAEALFETSLRNIQPAALPPGLLASLEAARSATSESSRIVDFPKKPSATDIRRHNHRPMLAAAAAVAILGAAAALFIPDKGSHTTASSPPSHLPPQPQAPSTSPIAPANQNFAPATFHTGLSQASDVGVLWQAQNQAQRVVKAIYWDRFTLVNPEGQQIEYEKPRVEYILVPEKID
ncbi:MAG: hypothetical protein WCJ66_10230 [Verrucomicrobiota bacterium]